MKKEKCLSKGVTIGGQNQDVYMPQFINFFKVVHERTMIYFATKLLYPLDILKMYSYQSFAMSVRQAVIYSLKNLKKRLKNLLKMKIYSKKMT